jgi:glyoxalase family protein
MSIGFHHLSLLCSNARRTLQFYTGVLGLRLVKVTVDFDNPENYHLYFGGHQGTPGTLISVYEWRIAPKAEPGVGGIERITLGVNDLSEWQDKLPEQSVSFAGPCEVDDQPAIMLRDPDGTEIVLVEESLQTPTPRIHHLSCVSADLSALQAFYGDLIGLESVPITVESGQKCAGWGIGGKALLKFEQVAPEQVFPARKGIGLPHHFALALPDRDALAEMRARLLAEGLLASEILDRIYYQSILTRDPDGMLVELSTLGPGVLVDESFEELGKGLMLPPWLEENRAELEENLAYLG